MRKKKKLPTESENISVEVNVESSIEYLKFINKLELQRIVLNKIVNPDLNQNATESLSDPDDPEAI